jgi:hypothetical protein
MTPKQRKRLRDLHALFCGGATAGEREAAWQKLDAFSAIETAGLAGMTWEAIVREFVASALTIGGNEDLDVIQANVTRQVEDYFKEPA